MEPFSTLVPAFILLLIVVLIISVWKTSPYNRLVHAVLILSLWLPVTLMLFETLTTYRTNHTPPISPIAGMFMAGIPILGLTSIDHFNVLFQGFNLGLPLFVSVCSLGAFYFLLMTVRKKLSQHSG